MRTTAAVLFIALAGAMFSAPARARCQGDSPVSLGKTRSKAETQHEIVILLIRKGEYTRAIDEASKIFAMRWPDDQEPLLLKELLYLSGKFLDQGQPSFGLQLIDSNSKCFKRAPSQVAIWKERGYLYKCLKQNDKALDCFREARRLETSKD